MSILIVDDTASQRLLLTSVLKSAGYTGVLTASSAEAALERLGLSNGEEPQSSDVDLILMDISMPDMDGIEACRRIKAVGVLQDVPIIMVTASTEVKDLEAAFTAGAMDYITKPPSKAAYARAVRLAREAIEELTHVARRAEGRS